MPMDAPAQSHWPQIPTLMKCVSRVEVSGGERCQHIPPSLVFVPFSFLFFSSSNFLLSPLSPICLPVFSPTPLVLALRLSSPPPCIHEMYIRCSSTPLNRPFELMAHGHGPVSPSPPSHCLQTSQIPDSSMAVYRVWNNHLVNYAKNEISIMRFRLILSCES